LKIDGGARMKAAGVASRRPRPWILAGFLLASASLAAIAQTATSYPSVQRVAPNFVLRDLHHQRIELRAYRGKVVLLNFWATWCGPCLVEIPQFAEWQKRYGTEHFQVLGISMDDAEAPVQAEERKLKLDYPVVMSNEKVEAAYGGILGLPITFLIGRNGRVRAKYQGAADLQAMEQEIKALLLPR
jgi:cytochrome c biogenesis protein CcmG, thiol:disulfide interchange protein DsbE